MGRLFGTDGVRGVAGRELTAPLAMDLAVAAVPVLTRDADGHGTDGHGAYRNSADRHGADRHSDGHSVAVIGRDSRASGDFLEAAVVAGLASAGVDVLRLGIIPTPGVAFLTGALGADFGVVLSASHNPAVDNGIKFFGAGGVKLPDAVEDEIEARLRELQAPGRLRLPFPPTGFGRVTDAYSRHETYLDHLLGTVPCTPDGQPPLAGLRVVVDCAHGAAYSIAPRALRRAGAEVVVIGAAPDGLNINAGVGSTHLEAIQAAVIEHGADAGLAFDGDADRCLAVDGTGQPLDGDQILTVLATDLKTSGHLAGDAVVVTVMSNLGFHDAMRAAGIRVIETPVGDKHVYAAMLDGGYVLGGEQSGHIIQMAHATTGDGVLTGLHLLAALNRGGTPLSAAAKMMTRYPQVLINVRGDTAGDDGRATGGHPAGGAVGGAVDDGPSGAKERAMADHRVVAAIAAAEAELGGSGRVLLRPSGTESAIRVMVEAADAAVAERVAGQLADVVRTAMKSETAGKR